jgi:hypothetical protein
MKIRSPREKVMSVVPLKLFQLDTGGYTKGTVMSGWPPTLDAQQFLAVRGVFEDSGAGGVDSPDIAVAAQADGVGDGVEAFAEGQTIPVASNARSAAPECVRRISGFVKVGAWHRPHLGGDDRG